MGPAARISTDALLLAVQYNVNIVVCDYFGHPRGRFTPMAFQGSVITRIAQLETRSSIIALNIVKSLLYAKLFNQKINL